VALMDYVRGPAHAANVARLEEELRSSKKSSQEEYAALQAKFDEIEAKAKEIGVLDLLGVQELIKSEERRLGGVQAQVARVQSDLAEAQAQLKEKRARILVAEETIELEEFSLYRPRYQLTNSAEYKARLETIREDQKATARGLSAAVDSWDAPGVTLTKAEWKQLRKDVLKLALRSFC
jgi:chromosome segregation ATPase